MSFGEMKAKKRSNEGENGLIMTHIAILVFNKHVTHVMFSEYIDQIYSEMHQLNGN